MEGREKRTREKQPENEITNSNGAINYNRDMHKTKQEGRKVK